MHKSRLELFISAAYHLNFTKAAEECHVTQATMSRQISNLEDEVGVPLFYRDRHGVRLTPGGIRLFNSATSYVEQYNDLITDCRRAHQHLMQKLRIGLGPYEYILSQEPIRLLHEKYPEIEIGCMLYTHKIMISRFSNKSIDMGFCTEACVKTSENLKYFVIHDEPWQVAARYDSMFWNLPAEMKSVLKDQIVITHYQNEMEEIKPYCLSNELSHLGFYETNFLQSQLALVQAGIGVAILPPFVKNTLPDTIRMDDVLKYKFAPKLVFAYDPKNSNPGIAIFARICKDYFKTL